MFWASQGIRDDGGRHRQDARVGPLSRKATIPALAALRRWWPGSRQWPGPRRMAAVPGDAAGVRASSPRHRDRSAIQGIRDDGGGHRGDGDRHRQDARAGSLSRKATIPALAALRRRWMESRQWPGALRRRWMGSRQWPGSLRRQWTESLRWPGSLRRQWTESRQWPGSLRRQWTGSHHRQWTESRRMAAVPGNAAGVRVSSPRRRDRSAMTATARNGAAPLCPTSTVAPSFGVDSGRGRVAAHVSNSHFARRVPRQDRHDRRSAPDRVARRRRLAASG